MFGYIVMNKPEIKMKDFDMYRTFYCGLCRELREKYGISGQITLSYDMTFVIMLLSGLYEPKTYKGTTRCILHPVKKQPVRKNVMTEYCADMNILLTYYKCLDDWNRISGLDFCILDESNQVFASTGDRKLPSAEKLIQFREDPALCISGADEWGYRKCE